MILNELRVNFFSEKISAFKKVFFYFLKSLPSKLYFSTICKIYFFIT